MSKFSMSLEERQLAARLTEDVTAQFKRKAAEHQHLRISKPAWLAALQEKPLLRKVSKFLPWVGLGVAASVRLMMVAPPMAIAAGLLGAVTLILRQASKHNPVVAKIRKKIGGRRSIQLVAALLFGGSLWMHQANPVFAQFFQAAEDFFAQTFPDAGDVVPIIFGVIRAIFLIYIAVSLVRIVNAARNDDDWQQMARAPVIIVMAIVLGDVLANLVIGA